MRCFNIILIMLCLTTTSQAQSFSLRTVNDSLSLLVLGHERWRLPYPVYQFQTGDVDGNGSEDALVGVIKKTRFHREVPVDGLDESQLQRRLFVFKNFHGQIRPMWLGSRLGGVLCDFRFVNGLVRTLEITAPGLYSVGEYRWQRFGFTLERYLVKDKALKQAEKIFYP